MSNTVNSKNNTITVKLHYARPDGVYTGWNAWAWTLAMGGKQYEFAKEKGEMVAAIKVDGYTTTSISFIVRKGAWEDQEFGERRIDVSTVASGTVHYYVTSGVEGCKLVLDDDAVLTNKLLAAELDYDSGKIRVQTSMPAIDPDADAFLLSHCDGTVVPVSNVSGDAGHYELTLDRELGLINLYKYKLRFRGYDYGIKTNTVYASKRFAAEFTYTGKDLGAVWTANATTFKVWAPTAETVQVALYRSGTAGTDDRIETVPMTRGQKGVWVATVPGNRNGQYYTYLVNRNGEQVEAVDPYARTTGVNGGRGMVIDLASTNPKGWDKDGNPNKLRAYTDAVLYELHVRDFSIDDSSGVSKAHQGKFLALTESGTTTPNGAVTGMDYLKKLGITHLHLLPVYDYGSVDESRLDIPQFNWGYDPVNFNVPEGSYSSDPYHGEVRIKEVKQMIKGLHDNGISVIMDVVYNHVYEAKDFCFNMLVPQYFSRTNGRIYSNGSGCGNDTASERSMVSKYIVDSVCYWADEYHIDGFRFDLVGLIDTDTINSVMKKVHEKHPNVIFYGEGWTMNTGVTKPDKAMCTQLNSHMVPQFAFFSDTIRDALRGSVFDMSIPGFVTGAQVDKNILHSSYMGVPFWAQEPTQCINYVSCHDNNTLIDRIMLAAPNASRYLQVRMNNLAAAFTLTAQGIPFFQAGEEMLRTKPDGKGGLEHNSFRSSDAVNSIKWNTLDEKDVMNTCRYYRGLLKLRKSQEQLRLATREEVLETVKPLHVDNPHVVAFGIGKKAGSQMLSIFNGGFDPIDLHLPEGRWDVLVNAESAGIEPIETLEQRIRVEPISAMILVKKV